MIDLTPYEEWAMAILEKEELPASFEPYPDARIAQGRFDIDAFAMDIPTKLQGGEVRKDHSIKPSTLPEPKIYAALLAQQSIKELKSIGALLEKHPEKANSFLDQICYRIEELCILKSDQFSRLTFSKKQGLRGGSEKEGNKTARERRDRNILHSFEEEDWSAKEIAREHGLSHRTVEEIVAKERKKKQ